MSAGRFGRAAGGIAVGALCYGLYASQPAPLHAAALKTPFALTHSSTSAAVRPLAAIAVLQPDGGSGVSGTVQFRQDAPGEPTHITATISGLKDGLHGFHIHQFGNLTRGCVTAGPHYNPFDSTHGDLRDMQRHVGDMGNVTCKGGKATYDAVDELRLIQLSGPTSIIGRAVVVHADPDDLGRGGAEDSKTTGHAGARVSHNKPTHPAAHACGVIGIDQA